MSAHSPTATAAAVHASRKSRLPNYAETLAALAEAFAADLQGAVPPGAATGASAFLGDTNARLPDYLRPVFGVLTLVFDLSALPRHGCVFHRLPVALRLRHIRAWEASRLKPRRSLMTYYRTLATFGLYAEVAEAGPAEPSLHAR